jgi:hypothetical protein
MESGRYLFIGSFRAARFSITAQASRVPVNVFVMEPNFLSRGVVMGLEEDGGGEAACFCARQAAFSKPVKERARSIDRSMMVIIGVFKCRFLAGAERSARGGLTIFWPRCYWGETKASFCYIWLKQRRSS